MNVKTDLISIYGIKSEQTWRMLDTVYKVDYLRIPIELVSKVISLKELSNIIRDYNAEKLVDSQLIKLFNLIYIGCNNALPELGLDRWKFVLLPYNKKKFDIKVLGDNLVFNDMILYDIKGNKPLSNINKSQVYHTSYTPGLRYLIPSMGGRLKNHSGHATPKIYFTTSPTTAGGLPLFRNAADEFLNKLTDAFKSGDTDWAIKYFGKLLAGVKGLTIYKLKLDSNDKIYYDPEHPNHLRPIKVYYVETNRSVPVELINDPDKLVSIEYIQSKYPELYEYYLKYQSKISEEIIGNLTKYQKHQKVLYRNKLRNFKFGVIGNL